MTLPPMASDAVARRRVAAVGAAEVEPDLAAARADLPPRREDLRSGSVALSLCTTAHPLYTTFTNNFGASIFS
jgi:hypothetical protein